MNASSVITFAPSQAGEAGTGFWPPAVGGATHETQAGETGTLRPTRKDAQ